MSTDTIASKLTDTERIATALLGWTFIQETNTHYRHFTKDGCSVWVPVNEGSKSESMRNADWPDFSTLDGCRLFEDALFAKLKAGCYRYGQILTAIRLGMAVEFEGHPLYDSCLRATPAQRVAACLRVLDEAGL